MAEAPDQPKLQVPDLPPTSADYDSFVEDASSGVVTPEELAYRFRPDGAGFATDAQGYRMYRDRRGELMRDTYGDANSDSKLRETRSVTDEQKATIRAVAERVKVFTKTEKGLQDTASFLSDVLSGTLNTQELAYRFRPDGAGFATDAQGYRMYRDRRGELMRDTYGDANSDSKLRETRSVTDEQKATIRAVAERVKVFTKTEKGLQDTASFLSDVLSGTLNTQELAYRFRPDGAGFATDAQGYRMYRDRRGELMRDTYGDANSDSKLRETRSVTDEQKKIITYIAQSAEQRELKCRTAQAASIAQEIVRDKLSIQAVADRAKQLGLDATTSSDFVALANLNGKLPNGEVDKAVEALLATGDDRDLLRVLDEQRTKYADISDTTTMNADITTLETYVQTARRISLRSRFWQQSNGSEQGINAALREIEEYEIVDDADKTIVGELRAEALGQRRDMLIATAFNRLGQDTPDFTTANLALQAAASLVNTLKDEEGQQVLAYVAEVTFQSEVNTYFGGLVKQLGVDRQQVETVVAQLDNAPIRAGIPGVDYFSKFQAAKEEFLGITDRLTGFAFEQELTELRKRFVGDRDVQGLVQEVANLPGETPEDAQLRQSLLDELALVVTARRGLDPGRFALLKEVEVEGIRANRSTERTPLNLNETIPERNAEAVGNLVRRFQTGVMPLFEALRGGADGDVLVDKYVSGRTGKREAYVQRIKALEEQRDLTDIEHAYLESVELLTVFNPHLVALMKEQPELTSLYLEQYFTSLDAATKERLANDSYMPVIQIGLGPNGVAAAGELNRVNATVAPQTLFIDAAPLPGGPFGLAKGQAWELNSANSISETTNNLPDVLPVDEKGISVRSYGSPLVSYPGERRDDSDVREASINVTVDYLPNPDNVSTKRYPTNADLARVLQLQSAMLVDNVMLSTKLVSVEPIADDGKPGNKRVTVEYQTSEGETVISTIRTDSIIVASGLGEPNYGIQLEGSEAEKIVRNNALPTDGFPRLTDTIGAFSILSSPEGEPVAPRGTVVIYGGGNSADVLIEYLGRQFDSGNPNLNGISKVYIVTTAELSKRTRYAQINDLKERNGQPNFLELVPLKVSDVRESQTGKLELLTADGQPIEVGTNGGRKILRADHVIAASGFRPMLDEVFGSLLVTGESLDTRSGLGKVALPSNPGFSVADELLSDPSVVIVGTGSRADFKNPNKLGQLPDEAREALLRNGAENAVAIGFRTPDTRAAIRLKFTGKEFPNAGDVQSRKQEVLINNTDMLENHRGTVPIADLNQLPPTRRDVDADSDTLSALFLETLPPLRIGEGTTAVSPSSAAATVQYTLQLQFDAASGQCSVQSDSPLPSSLVAVVEESLTNPYFQAYAMKALRGRRVNRGLQVSLAFNRGRLQYRDPGDVDGKGRTYVEVL